MIIPKIIENLREKMITAGKSIMLEKGYRALNIRDVAAQCNIAAGTVYNYFPSKDALCAAIMMVDWEQELKRAQGETSQMQDCITGLKSVYDALTRFTARYLSVWGESAPVLGMRDRYHPHLIQQLQQIILPLMKRFCPDTTPEPSSFICQILLSAATRPDVSFNKLQPFLNKLIR